MIKPAATVCAIAFGATLASAQVIPRKKTLEGYEVVAEIKTLAPEGSIAPGAAPEAQALIGGLASASQVTVKAQLAGKLSRIEIVSPGFVLPPGTIVLHDAGAREYVIADPRVETYVVMDALLLLDALEGAAGVVNSGYEARVRHTHEQKEIAGKACRKAVMTVTYASSVPFEATRIVVQKKNEVAIWHTPGSISTAALDHAFLEYRRDETGQVRKTVEREIGFPMELSLVVTGAQAAASAPAQRGSFSVRVTSLTATRFDPQLFAMPPTGYQRLQRNPYFQKAAAKP